MSNISYPIEEQLHMFSNVRYGDIVITSKQMVALYRLMHPFVMDRTKYISNLDKNYTDLKQIQVTIGRRSIPNLDDIIDKANDDNKDIHKLLISIRDMLIYKTPLGMPEYITINFQVV